MNCAHADNLLQKSLDELLNSGEHARLDTHLAQCPACRTAQDDYRRLVRLAEPWARRADPLELAPAEFTARVLSRIAQQEDVHSPPHLVWAALAAAVLLCVLSLAAAPLLPALPAWTPGWDFGALRGLWPETLIPVWSRWATMLFLPALAVNALLLVSARRKV